MFVCAALVWRADFTADLSAFLPRSPTSAQRLLIEQLREGAVSRLILVAIEGAAPPALADASRKLAARLRNLPAFVAVDNGERPQARADREFLWRNRYVLDPEADAAQFTVAGLRNALESDLRLLASPAGMLMRRTLAPDPTGAMLRIAGRLERSGRPRSFDGVWFSADHRRALLMAQTAAPGYDIDAQAEALHAIRGAFARIVPDGTARLVATGPGVFSVMSREIIREDVSRLAGLAAVLVSALLLFLFRSPRVLGLALLPVATGALAGVAAVSLGFGTVHGVTLGFGITLIGEGVDYAIYLFTQRQAGIAARATLDRIWPTLRLGVATSICGFSAMFLSDFPGLAQLGLFSIVGLLVAAIVTRWVLPPLVPAGFAPVLVPMAAPRARAALEYAPRFKSVVLGVVVLATVYLIVNHAALLGGGLESLNPVPTAMQRLDQELRDAMGAPDVRELVIVRGKDREAALRGAEQAGAALDKARAQGALASYQTPAAFLPSRHLQAARRAALPAPNTLRAHLDEALKGLPFRPGLFKPFLADVEAARQSPPISAESLAGTRLALRVDSLLVNSEDGWTAMLPLRGVTDSRAIQTALEASGAPAALVDIKRESDQLYKDYLLAALHHALIGAGVIVILLFAALRAPGRVLRVLAPLAAAVIMTTAILALGGARLSILHLVGLLLVVAVGSNYALFFERQAGDVAERGRITVSLLFASLTTVIGFGLLAFSRVPVLTALGTTVGIGAVLALLFAAVLTPPAREVKR